MVWIWNVGAKKMALPLVPSSRPDQKGQKSTISVHGRAPFVDVCSFVVFVGLLVFASPRESGGGTKKGLGRVVGGVGGEGKRGKSSRALGSDMKPLGHDS